MRYLIVNGDEFGISEGVNRAIVEAYRRGVLTSTSLMVNRAAGEDAAARSREVAGLDVGLHLECDGAPETAVTVVRDQFVRFERLLGRPPTHVDGYRDAHLRPPWLPHVLKFAGRCGVPVRGRSPVAPVDYSLGPWGGRSHLEQVGVESLIAILHQIPPGITELVCHPGYDDPTLSASDPARRGAELAALCDPRVREAMATAAIRLIGFRQLATLLAVDSLVRRPETGRSALQRSRVPPTRPR